MPEAIDYFLIQNLLNRYSDAVDRGDFDAVGRMFLHADVYFPGDEKPAIPTGSGGFAKQLTEWTRVYPDTGNPNTRHLCTNPSQRPSRADSCPTSQRKASMCSFSVTFPR